MFATYEILAEAELTAKPPEPALLVEQALYVVGSALFAVGTVLFTPPLEAGAGPAELADEAAQVIDVRWFGRVYEIVVAAGAAPPEAPELSLTNGDELFAVGSTLYAVAAFVSALRAAGETGGDAATQSTSVLCRRTAIATASLYELGGVCFVVGTLGFVPGGQLGIAACPDGSRRMQTFGAAIFVLGSLLYSLGSALTLGVQTWLTYNDDDLYEVAAAASSKAEASRAEAPDGPSTTRSEPPAITAIIGAATVTPPQVQEPPEGSVGPAPVAGPFVSATAVPAPTKNSNSSSGGGSSDSRLSSRRSASATTAPVGLSSDTEAGGSLSRRMWTAFVNSKVNSTEPSPTYATYVTRRKPGGIAGLAVVERRSAMAAAFARKRRMMLLRRDGAATI